MSAPFTLGMQAVDGLGRQRSVTVAGRTTRYHYQPGQLPPTANTLADGRRVAFTYEPQLGNALRGTHAEGSPAQQLTYHPTLGVPTQASGGAGSLQWQFSPSGQPREDTWTVDEQAHSTRWRHSLNGLPLGFTDAAGTTHTRQYDAFGRVTALQVGEVRTTFSYDAFSRPVSVTTHDPAGERTLVKACTYDAMGREQQCSYTLTCAGQTQVFTQTLAFSDLDQLISRQWAGAAQATAEETFAYDLRGRLVHYTANAAAAPQDSFGNAIVEQRFTFNAFDGLASVTSHFTDGSQDLATYHYAEHDPTQVSAIDHSHPSWPSRIELEYDACGRVIADSLGRRMRWDAHDHLSTVELNSQTCHYRYDPSGRLCERETDGQLTRSFFSAGQLTHEQQADRQLRLVGDGEHLFALSRLADGIRQTTLLGCDGQGSVRLALADETRQHRYSAHGAAPAGAEQVPFGYAGQRREPLTGWYIPAGYRPYDPLLMIFLAPDSESPFGRGGINPYSYCAGDPVNRIDPDGHSWVTWTAAGAGIALGLIATIASLGTAAPAVAGLFAGGMATLSANAVIALSTAALNVVSLTTGVAAMALEASAKDDQAASVLGWVSLGTGIASTVVGMTGSLAKATTAARKLGRRSAIRGTQSRTTAPYHWVRRTEVLHSSNGVSNDVAMHYNLWGKGIVAFETHGSKAGKLMNAAGKSEDAMRVAIKEIAPRLAGVPKDQPIVLLACYGGRSGAAQRIANALQRPVHGYDKTIWVYRAKYMQSLSVSDDLVNIPTQSLSRWQRLMGTQSALTAEPGKTLASGRMYYPM